MACAPNTAPLNFVIFGETGVGKSSLVNLLAGKTVAKSSSGLKCCTLESTEYTITSSEHQLNVRLFDTVGLNNVTMNGKSHLVDALVKAHKLVTSLQNQGGIHGLLFCIKGGNKILASTQQNYRLFHEFLCQENVPLALVITNLENEENMDAWWAINQGDIKHHGIVPVTQVCITTIMGLRNVYEDKYWESRKKVWDMLATLAREDVLATSPRGDACSLDINWFVSVCRKRRRKIMMTLTTRCKLPEQDAKQLLRRIKSHEN